MHNQMNTWKFFRKDIDPVTKKELETGKFEDVILEKWVWEAVLIDGTILKQFDDNGRFHQIREIDQKKLKEFIMKNTQTGQFITMLFDPIHFKLVHFYKRLGMDFTGEIKKLTLYVFGYEQQIGKLKLAHYNVITPTDQLVQTNNLQRLEIA